MIQTFHNGRARARPRFLGFTVPLCVPSCSLYNHHCDLFPLALILPNHCNWNIGDPNLPAHRMCVRIKKTVRYEEELSRGGFVYFLGERETTLEEGIRQKQHLRGKMLKSMHERAQHN